MVQRISNATESLKKLAAIAGLAPYLTALFAAFQGTFAIITPALIVGGLIDRIKFSALVIFVLLWGTFVYDPIAHWVWGGGYIGGGAIDLDPDLSPSYALDFAGGTVVHISSGFSALAGALILGRRLGYGKVPMEPHNVPMVVLGASILWFGWFGFNAGSEVMVDGITVSAWVVTNTATGVAAVTWVLMSWAHTGKPSIVGAATGAVAGLVAITPASGWVGPMASIIIGIAAGTVCYGCVAFKNARKWDDALDVWGVHGYGRHSLGMELKIIGKKFVFYSFTYACSPCWARSRPISSSFGVTLIPPGHTASMTLRITIVTPNA